MTAGRFDRAREVAEQVRSDCASDAAKLDSTPFTPRGVGEALGTTLAMVAALADVCGVLADNIEALRQDKAEL